MTTSILVCDDLPEERTTLFQMLRNNESTHGHELDVEMASDGTELLALWKPGRWDLIFLDIYMPKLGGIEAARRLRQTDSDCEIVFVTNSRDHGMEGYELHAMDYLTKPFTQSDVDGTMDWFFQQRSERRRELSVRTQDGEETVSIQNIRYIESRGHTCVIHVTDREYTIRRSIDELSAELNDAFFRCHKSFLLNFAHVAGIERNAFRLDDGSSIPISAANLTRSKTALLTWQSEMR